MVLTHQYGGDASALFYSRQVLDYSAATYGGDAGPSRLVFQPLAVIGSDLVGRKTSQQQGQTVFDSVSVMDSVKFFGSQIGGKSVINYGYTDMPWKLLLWDTRYFFVFARYLPWIVWPLTPSECPEFDELAPSPANLWCIFIHAVLIFLQLSFILALPIVFLLPAWIAIFGIGAFFGLNWLLCRLLNGSTVVFHSDPKYASASDEHAHEQWIFMNGVAVGETWLKSNLNRLAITFKRPVIGVHNQTSGIIFDVFECLIQRNLGYATGDVREAYKIVKEKLYNPRFSKIVLILHSQGGIEGGLMLDWLLQELPQDLLAKLEVYTFGNAANHFNNPHKHVKTQEVQEHHPEAPSTEPKSIPDDVPVESTSGAKAKTTIEPANGASGSSTVSATASASKHQAALPASDRVIGHIEHYAHTTDFVALWGVLHFATNSFSSPQLPRFIGRLFSRSSSRGGHQFSQHYLAGMFPLKIDPDTGRPIGCAEHNAFMDSVIEIGGSSSGETPPAPLSATPPSAGNGDAATHAVGEGGIAQGHDTGEDSAQLVEQLREGVENSLASLWDDDSSGSEEEGDEEDNDHSSDDGDRPEHVNGVAEKITDGEMQRTPLEQTAIHWAPAANGSRANGGGRHRHDRRACMERRLREGKVRVKDLSRLWLYRNGRSPPETPPQIRKGADGMLRANTR